MTSEKTGRELESNTARVSTGGGSTIITKRFIVCPGCNVYAHDIENLFDSAERAKECSFGPWPCQGEDCLTEISGTVHSDGTISFESKINQKQRRGFALLRLRDLYFVGRELYGRIESDYVDYFYHSHQCPTNLLQDIVKVYGPDGDQDPHGLIRYVAGIDDTPETRAALQDLSLCDVMKLFGTNGEAIDTNWPEAHGGQLPRITEKARRDDLVDVNVADPPRRDRRLVALLDAARELVDTAGTGPQFRVHARDALEVAALAWAAEECPICGRRGDHEWKELTRDEKLAHSAEDAARDTSGRN